MDTCRPSSDTPTKKREVATLSLLRSLISSKCWNQRYLFSLRFGPVWYIQLYTCGTIGVLLYMLNIPTRVVGERTLENQKSTSAAKNFLINKISPFYHQLAILWVLVCGFFSIFITLSNLTWYNFASDKRLAARLNCVHADIQYL